MVGKFRVRANTDEVLVRDVFRFEGFSVGSEDEFGLVSNSGRTLPQGSQSGRYGALRAGFEMDVVALEHPARQVGLVGGATFQPLEDGFLVPKRFQKGKREGFGVEGLSGELGNGFLDFDGVHTGG